MAGMEGCLPLPYPLNRPSPLSRAQARKAGGGSTIVTHRHQQTQRQQNNYGNDPKDWGEGRRTRLQLDKA